MLNRQPTTSSTLSPILPTSSHHYNEVFGFNHIQEPSTFDTVITVFPLRHPEMRIFNIFTV